MFIFLEMVTVHAQKYKLPKPLVKAEKYLNADILNRGVRNISVYNDHLQVWLEDKSIQDVIDSKLKEMEDKSNE